LLYALGEPIAPEVERSNRSPTRREIVANCRDLHELDGKTADFTTGRRDQAVTGRSVGGIGAGSVVVLDPVRNLSTAAAAARPSAIAHTIND
jgi:hypothetical protein